mmetsp:Transcript_8914/g.21077  ORF Transcript_8914/g.21077 Transcript_8914/m.21077 type:complete len:452 (+) Transcript_8914:1433-2788(+)
MRAIHSLDVHLGVPIGVEEHDPVGLLQVQPEPARARREQEDELVRVRPHEVVDHLLANVAGNPAVDAAVPVVAVPTVVLQDVQHARHLAEDQDPAALCLGLVQQLVEHAKLRAVLDQMLPLDEGRPGLLALEEVRVVAALAELHHNVEQPRALAALAVDRVNVLLQHARVQRLLHLAHGNVHVDLGLLGEALLDVGLEAAEEEGAKDAVQLPGHLLGLLGGLEERIEVIGVCELVWQQEVEQRPQLVQVVLQRRAREQQARVGLELADHERELRVLVLDPVSLIDDKVAPVELLKMIFLAAHNLEARDDHVKLPWLHLLLELGIALVLASSHVHDAVVREPLPELSDPVGHGRLGREHHVRTRRVLELCEVPDHRDGLHRLAEPHLVGEDAADPVVVQTHQPVEPLQLILPQRTVLEARGLHRQPLVVREHAGAARLCLCSLQHELILCLL